MIVLLEGYLSKLYLHSVPYFLPPSSIFHTNIFALFAVGVTLETFEISMMKNIQIFGDTLLSEQRLQMESL